MSSPEQIICKPTPWFTLRAIAMLAMFSVFAVLFYIDGTTGYRKKNLEYYIHNTFEQATKQFSDMNSDGSLTEDQWKKFAEEQTVKFPKDTSVLPKGTQVPMPWPEMLTEFEKVKPLQHNLLWQEYTKQQIDKKLSIKPEEKPFDAKKIREQIIVFYICLTLALIALFFLVRTARRSMIAGESTLITAKGKEIPYSEMKSLDLRKWETKGIAFIDHEGTAGSGRARIDGLTYGGFKKDNGEPAEKLMQKIRANFSGEIIEYTTEEETETSENPGESTETK